MEKTKIIKYIDDDTWSRFVGSCYASKVKVGHKLSSLLSIYLEQEVQNEIDSRKSDESKGTKREDTVGRVY